MPCASCTTKPAPASQIPFKQSGKSSNSIPIPCISSIPLAASWEWNCRVDDWGIDIALTSSQKAFALPPGIAFAAVSDRLLERAKSVPYRGYYFDFLTLETSLLKNNTPSTPPVALMFAADAQMDQILVEGVEARWQRHRDLRDATHRWALERGFGLFAQDDYRSNTVTTVENLLGIDVDAMGLFMQNEVGFVMDKGYGKIKGSTFRLPHMGDVTMDMLREVLNGIDAFMALD